MKVGSILKVKAIIIVCLFGLSFNNWRVTEGKTHLIYTITEVTYESEVSRFRQQFGCRINKEDILQLFWDMALVDLPKKMAITWQGISWKWDLQY